MAVEAYVGTYVSAESATNYIDIGTIQSGCQFMIEESNNFQEAAELLQNAADTCDNEAFSSRMKALVGDSYYSELKNRQSGHIAVINREGSSPSLYGICLINYRARDKYVYVLYDSTSDNLTVIQCETPLDDEYIDYKQEKSDYKIPHSFINRKLHYSSDM